MYWPQVSLSSTRFLPVLRKLSPASAMMPTLQLNPKEQQLKRLLIDAAAYIDTLGPDTTIGLKTAVSFQGRGRGRVRNSTRFTRVKDSNERLVLRWAGGWVRDKLLGQQSHDIDVAINCMTGEIFCELLRRFCVMPEIIGKHRLRESDVGNMHTIAKNPEKSKNLETATVNIFGLDVDFVNLRTETYARDSRNPRMRFGTAQEDAHRRDATVNALFYNIHTDQVEDFVGGLEDLQAQVLRTPLDPFQTFMDDPLRVLRLVRFASRFGFTIEPTVMRYMGNERVLESLRVKITRERVGVELEKMLKGERAIDAVCYIHELGLYHAIFTDPARDDMPRPDLAGWGFAYQFLHQLAGDPLGDVLITTDEERYFAWVLACVVPFARGPPLGTSKNILKNPPQATLAVREGFKAPSKVSELVTGAWGHLDEIATMKDLVRSQDERIYDRGFVGMAIRRWNKNGKYWRLKVLFAMLEDVMTKTRREPNPEDVLAGIRSDWQGLMDHIQKLDLADAPEIEPLINGRMLSKAMKIKPGKWMSPAMLVCMEWQLRNPRETRPEKGYEELRSRMDEMGITELLPKN